MNLTTRTTPESAITRTAEDVRRDPRVDPQDGDVLRKGNIVRVVVCREYGQGATFMANMVQVADGGRIKKPREKRPTLRQFRRWAANATVEHTA